MIEWSLVLEPDRLSLMGGKHYWHHSQFDRRRVCMMIWGVLIFTHIYRRHWRLLTGCSICHHSVVAMERERKMTPSYYLLSSAIRFYLVWEVHEFWKPMKKMWTRFLIFFSLRCKMQYTYLKIPKSRYCEPSHLEYQSLMKNRHECQWTNA